jgi:hypothetical protein
VENFNEYMITIIFISCLGFTDFVIDLETQYEWGWYVIAMVSFFIFVNIIIVAI